MFSPAAERYLEAFAGVLVDGNVWAVINRQ